MLLKDISPNVRVAIATELTEANSNVLLKSIDCRMFYILSGDGVMEINGNSYPLHNGCVILFQSGNEYRWIPGEAGISFIAINFDYTQNYTDMKNSFHTMRAANFDSKMQLENIHFSDVTMLNKPLYVDSQKKLENKFRYISTEFHINEPFGSELISSELKSIIIRLVRDSSVNYNSEEHAIVRDVILYIQNNFDKDISNTAISSRFAFHANYLNRIFKEHTDSSLHSFVANYRISMATELLTLNNDLSIAEIAERVGFHDVVHFIKSFKAKVGITPSKFRHRGKKLT